MGKTTHTFKPMAYYDLVSHITGKDEGDWADDDWVDQNAWENVDCFMHEFLRDNELAQKHIDAVQDAVYEYLTNKAQESMARARQWAIKLAIEQVLSVAGVSADVTAPETKHCQIKVAVDKKDMLKAWSSETEGTGLVAWDSSLTCSDIKDLKMLCNILNSYCKVYVYRSLAARYNDCMKGFEPDMGNFSETWAIAEKALKKAIRAAR